MSFFLLAWHLVETEATVCYCNKYLLAHWKHAWDVILKGHNGETRKKHYKTDFFFF